MTARTVNAPHIGPHLAWDLIKETAASWKRDHAPSMGAAIAYYTAFSIAPLLLIAIAVAGLAFGVDAARGEVVTQLQGLMGDSAARAIQGMLQSADKPGHGLVSTLIGTALLIIGATTVFAELQDALDRIWRQRLKPAPDTRAELSR